MTGVDTIEDVDSLSRQTESRNVSLGALGIVGFTAILWWLSGVEALLLAVPVGVVWYVTSAPYAVAAAHIALVALAPSVPGAALVAFEGSALAVLLGDIHGGGDGASVSLLLAVTVATTSLAVIAYWVLAASGDDWVAAGALAVAFALSAYGLHRYGVVRRQLREGTYE